MTKPAYVSIEFWREDRDDRVTIEGWMTLETPEFLFVSPSLDYDAEIVKFAVPNDKVISITPAQSVREFAKRNDAEQEMNVSSKGKIPLLKTFKRMGLITEEEFQEAVGDPLDRGNTLIEGAG